MNSHKSVCLSECIQYFADKNLTTFVDGTLGAAGHAEAILTHHPEIERFIGIDRDLSALEIAKQRLAPFLDKVTLIHGNYSNLKEHLEKLQIKQVDGMFFDFGVSSMQFDQPARGFSFQADAPLDMRMDLTASLTASQVLRSYTEKELGFIFKEYGEEPKWRQAAKAIVEARKKSPIQTTKQLVDLLLPILSRSSRKIHPLTLIFQALRIEVNHELEGIRLLLPQALDFLAVGGRLGIISFHSLEDRLVKTAFLQAVRVDRKNPPFSLLNKKPLVATFKEQKENSRSRSAKLRFIEKNSIYSS